MHGYGKYYVIKVSLKGRLYIYLIHLTVWVKASNLMVQLL